VGVLGFALYVAKRIARREEICRHQVTGICPGVEIPRSVRRFEGAAQQVTSIQHMFHPLCETSEVRVGPGLKAPPPSLFDQFVAELGEAKPALVIAEARACHRT